MQTAAHEQDQPLLRSLFLLSMKRYHAIVTSKTPCDKAYLLLDMDNCDVQLLKIYTIVSRSRRRTFQSGLASVLIELNQLARRVSDVFAFT